MSDKKVSVKSYERKRPNTEKAADPQVRAQKGIQVIGGGNTMQRTITEGVKRVEQHRG